MRSFFLDVIVAVLTEHTPDQSNPTNESKKAT